MLFGKVYPLYIQKVERKGQTKEDLDDLIKWLTGYDASGLNQAIKEEWTFKEFFEKAPQLNPNRQLVKGVICGVRVEEIEDELTREVRILDKIVDELAKGKKMEKIKRKSSF